MFTIEDLLLGNQGNISIEGAQSPLQGLIFTSVQHDSRQCKPGDLYMAIKGDRVDGHSFIPDVVRAGAAGVLCTHPHPDAPSDFLQLVVPDVVKAVQATARVRVQRQPETLKIGITGSSGKTTTKESVAAVLSSIAPTLKTYASYNTEIGYPLTLLRLEDEQRYAVLEMGAEYVGELRNLCETIVSPDWSLITTVGTAHLKSFGSRENIAIAKSELVQVLSKEGVALLNYDDPAVRAMSEKTKARVIYYGCDPNAHVSVTSLEASGLFGTRITLRIEREEMPVQLTLPGMHGVTTALAAAAVGYAAGVPFSKIRDVLETLKPARGRGEVKPGLGPNGSTLIDDTYNAGRQAIAAMAQALLATPLPASGKRWAVLGEIFDLAEYSQEEHYISGKALGACDYLVAIGDNARYFVNGAQDAGMPAEHTYYFEANPTQKTEVEAAKRAVVELLHQQVKSEDMVLVKGSRGMAMETLLAMF